MFLILVSSLPNCKFVYSQVKDKRKYKDKTRKLSHINIQMESVNSSIEHIPVKYLHDLITFIEDA